jgi:hypothetical protein
MPVMPPRSPLPARSSSQADLAPRHRHARHRVDHQQHMLALIAEILRDGRGDERAARADERRLVAGGDDEHRPLEPFLAERVLDEVAHLAATLAEQRDHVHVGLRMPRDHAQHGALADARAGEDADTLAASDGEQAVDRAHARLERTVDDLALERVRRFGGQRHTLDDVELALAVDRMPEAVQHAAEHPRAHVHTERATERLDGAARMDAIELAERHEQHTALVEADHLGQHGTVA